MTSFGTAPRPIAPGLPGSGACRSISGRRAKPFRFSAACSASLMFLPSPQLATSAVAKSGDLVQDLRMPQRMFGNRKERRFDAILRKSVEHHAGIAGPRSVVEGEHHLVREQELVRLVLCETETWPPAVSLSTVRMTPSALGLVQGCRPTANVGEASGATRTYVSKIGELRAIYAASATLRASAMAMLTGWVSRLIGTSCILSLPHRSLPCADSAPK